VNKVVPLPAEAAGLPSPSMVVGTGMVLGGSMLVGSAALSAVISAVEMTATGSAVVTPLTGVDEAWLKIIVVSSVGMLGFVAFDVTGAVTSEAMTGIVVVTSVVMAGEVCCGTLVLFDETSTTSEIEDDTGSLVIAESMTLDTAGASVGDARASVVAAVVSPVVTLDEDTLENSGSSDCCDSIPVSIAVEAGGTPVDSSDCCDSIPVSIGVVIEGTPVDDSDAPEATPEGCAEMTKVDS
jgi:hypothetical protein